VAPESPRYGFTRALEGTLHNHAERVTLHCAVLQAHTSTPTCGNLSHRSTVLSRLGIENMVIKNRIGSLTSVVASGKMANKRLLKRLPR
jgi:hypothetical protein